MRALRVGSISRKYMMRVDKSMMMYRGYQVDSGAFEDLTSCCQRGGEVRDKNFVTANCIQKSDSG